MKISILIKKNKKISILDKTDEKSQKLIKIDEKSRFWWRFSKILDFG